MEFFDFITDEELQNLPMDDPERAFVAFVRLADGRLDEKLEQVQDEQYASQAVEEAQYGFMNVVYSAAANFGIKPFADEQVPLRERFGWEVYRQFRANLSHYIGQLMFRTVKAEQNDSAALTDPIRKSLREHIASLRDAIDASNLPNSRKVALHQRLDALEAELQNPRIRFAVAAGVVITVLSLPGALWASYDVVVKASAMIMRDLGEAKAAEDENRRPVAPEPPVALKPPRPAQLEKQPNFLRDEMDDEIPF